MKKILGGIDRTTRIVIGLGLLAAAILAPIATGWKAGLIALAAIALITGVTGFCPLWHLLGINTRKHEDTSGHGHLPREESSS